MKSKLINLFLRGAAIGIRFLFVFFLGKQFSLDFVDDYSLWNTTITLAVLLVGLDFYTYSSREIIRRKKTDQFTLVKDHGVFLFLSYLVFFPIIGLALVAGDVLPDMNFMWFYLVLFLEHIGLEFYRLFNTLERPIFSNFILFVRTALWVVVLALYWLFTEETEPSMEAILKMWAGGALISNAIGFGYLMRYYKGAELKPVNWKYLKVGLRASIQLLFATLFLKVIEFSDRYMIEAYLDDGDLGAFTIYYQLTNLINVVVYTVVVMMLYPKLYKSIFDKDGNEASLKNKMLKQSLMIWAGIGALLIVGVPFLLNYMGKIKLNDYFELLYLMLGAVLFFNVYFVYKTSLNAKGKDLQLLIICGVGAVVNLIINFLLIPKIGVFAASISSIVSYFILAAGAFVVDNNGR